MADSEIKVGEGGRKSRLPRWQFVLSLVVAMVLAGGAGALVRYMQGKGDGVSKLGESVVFPDSVTDSKALLQAGKVDEAEKMVQESLKNGSLPSEEKRLLYVEQGRIANVREDYKAAGDAYAKAFAIKETYDIASKLGAISLQLDDKAKAIEYYKKAIELNPKDSPTYESENRIFQQMIDALEQEV